ncbi:HupE/UreJ family protein [Uliginosibacterium sp. H3]|uniref:HupE/UreJ family protein n=1 Tax=Uliginosibacterium silvisoli TaxID=3114758 RepID=A0ABU6K4B2_9RHOO|nr:HupE/UreJ family protein [Uliginosibacterium sp. H3]
MSRPGGHIWRGAAACALLLFSLAASAHGDVRGVKGFYAGVLHPFLAPAHFMALVALGLLIGQRGMAAGRDAILTLVFGLFAGLLASSAFGYPETDSILLGLATLLGLIVAIALQRLPGLLLAAVSGALGMAIGVGSAPDRLQGMAWWIMAGGTFLSAFFCVMVITIGVESLRKAWMHIGVRVLGSWLTAAALLVLALSFAKHAPQTTDSRAGNGNNALRASVNAGVIAGPDRLRP